MGSTPWPATTVHPLRSTYSAWAHEVGSTGENRTLQLYAAIYLGELGSDAQAAVPDMLACIDSDPKVCFPMFEDLDKIGPDAKALVPVAVKVIKAYTDGGGKAGQLAAPARLAEGSLAKIGPAAKDAVPALIGVLKLFEGRFYDLKTLLAAMDALGEIGPDAAEALPILRTFLDEDFSNVNTTAEKAMPQDAPQSTTRMCLSFTH